MITFRTGNILESEAEALVNTVNCVGVMGRGIALGFKNAFPENFKAYERACRRSEVQPGRMFVFETGHLAGPRLIINFPTKRHWRGKSRIEDIESGLHALVAEIRQRGIRSIAVPPLGSGLGGLDWREVRPRIVAALGTLADVEVTVFEPNGSAPALPSTRPERPPRMTAGRAALIGLVRRYLAGLMDPFVTLLEVHKLMYFMQEAGEPLQLRYVQAPYGPYAENLRHVLREIEGHYLSGYAQGGDDPEKELTLVPGATEDAEAFLASHQATQDRFERVAELVRGFETPFGLELLATVHWVATRSLPPDDDELLTRTYEWSVRKKRFSPAQIGLALGVLRSGKWVPNQPRSAHAV
jgi:O-acetyl-ADP-ribose deacetylase (regulator of RNase III)